MLTVETLKALGTPFEIAPETLAACTRFDPDLYSDLHKSAHGVRPICGLGDRTAAQLDALWEMTVRAAEEAAEEEVRREAQAIDTFNEEVAKTIQYGAGDYATAIRWMMEAADADDIEYLVCSFGIFCGKFLREVEAKVAA